MTLPPWLLIKDSASGRVRFGKVPVITNVFPARKPGDSPASRRRLPGRRRPREGIEQALVVRILEELVDTRRDHGSNLGHGFEIGQGGGPDGVEGRESLRQDLGASGSHVADRQPGQEPIQRPRLALLERLTRFWADFFPIRSRPARVASSSR